MAGKLEELEELIKFIYENVQYAEFNTKSEPSNVCGPEGEIIEEFEIAEKIM